MSELISQKSANDEIVKNLIATFGAREVTNIEFCRALNFTENELKYAVMFSDSAFNKSMIYLSDEIILGMLTDEQGSDAIRHFYDRKLIAKYEENVDYFEIDVDHELVQKHLKSCPPNLASKKFKHNKRFFAVTGDCFKCLLMESVKGKVVRRYYLKMEQAAFIMKDFVVAQTKINLNNRITTLSSQLTIEQGAKTVLATENKRLSDVNYVFARGERCSIKVLSAQMSFIRFEDYPLSCLYVIFLGEINGEFWFKFGHSKQIQVRWKTHKSHFGDDIQLVALLKCTNGDWLEERVKEYLHSIGALRKYKVPGSADETVHREIFATSMSNPLVSMIARISTLRDRNMTLSEAEVKNINQETKIELQASEINELKSQLAQKTAECAAAAAKVQVYEHLIQNVVPMKKDARDAAINTDTHTSSDGCAQTEPETQESARTEPEELEESEQPQSDSKAEEESEASAEIDNSTLDSESSYGSGESEAELEADESECEDENSKEAATIQKLPSIKPYRRSKHKKNPPVIKKCESCGRDNQEFYKSRQKCAECTSIDLQTGRRIENPELYEHRDEQAELDAKGLRRCGKPTCNKVKPKSAFDNMKKGRFGKALWCKECSKAARKKNYEKECALIDPNLKQYAGSALYYIKDGVQSDVFESMTKLDSSINICRKIISKYLDTGEEFNGYKFIKVTKKRYYYIENGIKSRGYEKITEFSKAVNVSDRVLRKYISTKAEYRGRTFLFE